jgi:hypothetical protein
MSETVISKTKMQINCSRVTQVRVRKEEGAIRMRERKARNVRSIKIRKK